MKPILLTAALGLIALPATAERALLSGVPDTGGGLFSSGPRAAQVLSRAGFAVAEVGGSGQPSLRDGLAGLLDGLEEEDRLVIHLSGDFVRSARSSWYLGAEGQATDLTQAGLAGVDLDVVLEIAARLPGAAFVLLGEADSDLEHGDGLEPGIGALDVPQGVTVLRGPAEDLARLAVRSLYVPGADLAAALAGADGITASGFLPRGHAIQLSASPVPAPPPPAPTPAPAPQDPYAEERAFWESVLEDNSETGYRDYLQRYPLGLFRTEATARLQALLDDPQRLAEAAEQALGLTRAQRRQIQQDLTDLGFDTRGVDGIFGAGSRAAISAWQTSIGAPATGFISAVQRDRLAQQAGARRAEIAAAQAADTALWTEIGGTEADAQGLRRYLDAYPQGLHAQEAQDRLDRLDAIAAAPTSPEDKAAWLQALQTDTPEGYLAYLRAFPQGFFAPEARSQLDLLEGPQRQAWLAEERALGLNPITLLLIERRLSQVGYDPGNVDGNFTPQTRMAIRAYQTAQGLEATGFLNRPTLTRMVGELGIILR